MEMFCRFLVLFLFLFQFFFCSAGEDEKSPEKTQAEAGENSVKTGENPAAGEGDKRENQAENGKKDEKDDGKKLGIIAFPIVFYSSDTSAGFGATAVLHKEHYKDETVSKSNSLH